MADQQLLGRISADPGIFGGKLSCSENARDRRPEGRAWERGPLARLRPGRPRSQRKLSFAAVADQGHRELL